MFHCNAHTCECVSIELSIAPVVVFQNLMQRSAVPPPDANRLLLKRAPRERLHRRLVRVKAVHVRAVPDAVVVPDV